MSDKKREQGAKWLISDGPAQIVSPEDFSRELKDIIGAVRDFGRKVVVPKSAALETHDKSLLKALMKEAGGLGLYGIDIPEQYGGLGMDMVAATAAVEALIATGCASFVISVGAHAGIGTWPIRYFGSEEQRVRFLPVLASGEKIGAYALTEPQSGSDALSARCKAELSPDGCHWVVNGEKSFITNAGIADVFIVFVKIGGQPACLIVERGTPGLTVGREEEKMGIRGSSTCSLSFDDALVPAENLLGAIGQGHHIVLNTLNLGRLKLAAGALGMMKWALAESVAYAKTRKQFGLPIAAFDLIQVKLAEMATAALASEGLVYRVCGLLDVALKDVPPGAAAAKVISDYALECSAAKFGVTDLQGEVIDQALQIFGGYGFIEEYPVCRAYRDCRVNRIFEGTNEINRLFAAGEALKKAMRGEADLMLAAERSGRPLPPDSLGAIVHNARRAAVQAFARSAMTFGAALQHEQQLMAALADMFFAVFSMESVHARCLKREAVGKKDAVMEAAARLWFLRSLRVMRDAAGLIMSYIYEGGSGASAIDPWLVAPAAIAVDDRRTVARAVIDRDGYPF